MDFGNLCGRINVDAIRGKIALPTLPSMPEIKLPKTVAKLKSCKLFRSSTENTQVTRSRENTHSQRVEEAIHPAEFINHTPMRISTISSLMQESQGFNLNEEDDQSSYRRADSIDDYPTPLNQKGKFDYKRPSSAIRGTSHLPERPVLPSPNNVKLSLIERLQKTYKNVCEFNLKQVFAKETVVRKDNIVVDYYVKRFKEDHQREFFEQEDRDRKIGNNYSFQFKTPCKSDGDSFDESSADEESSSKHVQYKRPIKSVSEHSDDESGMESIPPKRKPDVTACEFHRIHSPPLHISKYGERDPIKHNIPNVIPKGEQLSQYPVIEKDSHQPKSFIFKSYDDINDIRNEDDNKSSFTSEKASDRIRYNLKMQKSKILRISHPTKSNKIAEQSDKDVNQESKQELTKNQQNDERLRRIRSVENVDTSADDKEEIMLKSHRTQLASKLHNFKRSFQKTHSDLANTEGEDPASNSRFCLMEKLQQIRVRKQSSTTDDPDDDEQDGKSYKESFAARAKFQLEKGVILASQVPQRTMEKINETKRHFKKSPSKNKREQTAERKEKEEEEDFDFDDDSKTTARPYSERDDVYNSKREYLKYVAESQEEIAAQSGTIAWTTKPIFNDSIDLEKDAHPTLKPRVLIHQDNTDGLESTLIIAVTRSRTHSPSPFITELPPDSPILSSKRQQQEINTDNSLSLSTTQFNVEDIRQKLKRQSLESIDLNRGSCTKNKLNKIDFRHTSAIDLTLSDEEDDVWNRKTVSEDKKLYRRKSIEIFETTLKQGSVKMAFEDFDEELKNIPIIEIKKHPEEELIQNVRYIDGLERESSEEMDAADDDNSSRVTKILAPPKHPEFITETVSPSIRIVEETLKNNPKTDLLINNNRDNKQSKLRDVEASTNDRKSQEFSPPPCPISLTSPPPPHSPRNIELEKRSPSIPPLPKTKPPVLPPRQCNKITKPVPKSFESPNKVRISKPLVKTSSLRLTYTDHVHTKDTGKVNKLISCFEKPNSSDKPTPFIIRHQSLIYPDCTDETSENDDGLQMGIKMKSERDVTPTNDSFRSSNLDINQNTDEPVARITPPLIKLAEHISLSDITQSMQDLNSNFSGSLYGSPTTYPSSLIGSAEATPVSKHKQQDALLHTRRDNRLSVTRDDDRFYSFDSDEDNSYYSISSTNSSRYVVEL